MNPRPTLDYIGNGVWTKSRLSGYYEFWLYITVHVNPSCSLETVVNTTRVLCIEPELDYLNNEFIVVTTTISTPGTIVLGSIDVGHVGWPRRRRTI